MSAFDTLLAEFHKYRHARKRLLSQIGVADSQRDPLSEFAERLALVLLGGRLSESRVQKGYDLIRETGAKVQVKYLANPAGKWRNEHEVRIVGCDEYALLLFEDLSPLYLLVFKKPLLRVCAILGKRHGAQETTLQLTQRNFDTLVSEKNPFRQFGVEVHDIQP